MPMSLEHEVCKLAAAHPELRKHLVPLLRKQGGAESLITGPVDRFDKDMLRVCLTLKQRVLKILQQEIAPEGTWLVKVSFFHDDFLTLRVEIYDRAGRGEIHTNMYAPIAATLGVSASEMERVEQAGTSFGRWGTTYEFSLQVYPGIVSTD